MNARSILIISLGLNLVFGTWVGAKLWRAPGRPAAVPASEAPRARSLPIWSLAKTNVIEISTNHVDPARFRWATLETNDFEAYVANLRGINCPEHVVRHLVMGEIEALYAERIVDAERPGSFWETPRQKRMREAQTRREQIALEDEKREITGRLFHVPWSLKAEREWVTDENACLIIGFIPDEKAMRLVDTVMRLETQARFKEETDHIVIDTDEPRLEAMLAEAKVQMEFGLSPLEVEEATLRGINLALSFMNGKGLVGVSLTGDELRRITAISSRGKDFITLGLRTELDEERDEEKNIQEIMMQLSPETEREIAGLLGPQRFADYERSKDEAFREFAGIASGLEQPLPLEATVKAYDIRRAAEAAVRQLDSNLELPGDQKRAAMDGIRRETEQAITAAVGPAAAKEFFRQDRGWARNTFGARGAKR